MRIALPVGECVMLPMAGHPFLGDDRRGQPQPRAHRNFDQPAESDPAVRLRAVQKQRYTDIREVAGYDEKKDGLPPL